MCGIIGYTGDRYAPEILIQGLKKLEYRGYDSAGIAVSRGGETLICKKRGKVEELEKKVQNVDFSNSHCGIGHTRWATHGEPSDVNSHPHSGGRRVTLVHNGIIENYLELKEELASKGIFPVSQTDTEIGAMLIESMYDGDPLSAIYGAIAKMRGSLALGILFSDHPGTIYAVRRDSPLIIGVGENENFIASDIPAILPYTKNYYLADEDEAAVITKDSVRFFSKDGQELKKELLTATWDEQSAQKGGYKHFMLKEIYEQPAVISATVGAYKNGTELFESCSFDFDIKGKIRIVACGSAMHAALLGKFAIEKLARIPVSVDIASEFRYDDPILSKDDVVIAISQSGETADTLAAVRLAKAAGVRTLGIVNVWGSTLSREADDVIYTYAGPEICVATTKAYLCQTAVLEMMALKLGRSKLGEDEYKKQVSYFDKLPSYIEKALELDSVCRALARKNLEAEHQFYIGRGQDYCVCTEASLKLKEISYVHSESYAAGELKHGTISLVVDKTPVIAVMTERARIAKTVSNIKEVASRGAAVICVTYDDVDVSDFCSDKIIIEAPGELLAPIIANVPLQLYAYHIADGRGNDVDKPRNLAKSVTVE